MLGKHQDTKKIWTRELAIYHQTQPCFCYTLDLSLRPDNEESKPHASHNMRWTTGSKGGLQCMMIVHEVPLPTLGLYRGSLIKCESKLVTVFDAFTKTNEVWWIL